MEPIITDNNVVNFSNLDISIAELDKFIEAQCNALTQIHHETGLLEELKLRAVAQPDLVLRDITGGEHNALKFSDATLRLTVDLPEIDWTLLKTSDLNTVVHPRPLATGSSRIDKMRKHLSNFHQELAQLPSLPPELLDNDGRDAEERGKKRRRIDSVPCAPVASSSSGLRLPQLPNPQDDMRSRTSSIAKASQLPEPRQSSTPSSSSAGGRNSTNPADATSQLSMGHSYSPRRTWASKGVSDDTSIRHASPTLASPTSQDTLPTPTQSAENAPVTFATEELQAGLLDTEETPSTFKQNWTLAEQHTLERLLVEIPSTVKFRRVFKLFKRSRLISIRYRWVRISEAMGGTRTPRQVASRVQKYYEKMKKLGVAVNSAEMGGGGRGGSKATEVLDVPPSMRSRGPSTRGKPKTGPQYTKSGRRR